MAKKKKPADPVEEKEEQPTEVVQPPQQQLPLGIPAEQGLAVFDQAELELQRQRHKTIGTLFDRAATVIETYLEDPNTDLSAKMFPAKLATDIFMAQEKFKREDERIELEKRKISLEEVKVQKAVNINLNQQNNYNFPPPQPGQPPVDLNALKKKQDAMLASYLPPPKPLEPASDEKDEKKD